MKMIADAIAADTSTAGMIHSSADGCPAGSGTETSVSSNDSAGSVGTELGSQSADAAGVLSVALCVGSDVAWVEGSVTGAVLGAVG